VSKHNRRQSGIPNIPNQPPAPPRRPRLAIVCAYRNEPDLAATLESATAAAAGCDVTVYHVEDKTSVGPGRARHAGITKAVEAGAEYLAIIDAHMRFSPGLLAGMVAEVQAEPTALLCAPCHHNERCAFDSPPYRGARFTLRADNQLERVALCAQWAGPEDTANAVMGACYVMAADWYQEIGAPLRLLHSWGSDEEYMSAATWFAGGRVGVSGAGAAAHLYRNAGVAEPGPALQAGIWANRIGLLRMLPLSAARLAELEDWTRQSAVFNSPQLSAAIAGRLEAAAPLLDNIRDRLAGHGRDPEEWLAQARNYTTCDVKLSQVRATRPPAPPPGLIIPAAATTPAEPPQVVLRQVERCDRCDQVNPFRIDRSMRRVGDAAEVGYARCSRCGHRAKIIRG
jgi:hypothetical protein